MLFAERVGARRDSGKGPPTDGRDVAGEGEDVDAVDLVGGGSGSPIDGVGSGDGYEARRDSSAGDGARRDGSAGDGARRDGSAGDGARRDGSAGDGARHDGSAGDGVWRERAGMALRERLPVWLQARYGLERRNAVALSVLLVVAAAFAVQHFWTGRTQSVQAPEVVRAVAPFGESGSAEGTAGEGGGRGGGTRPAVSGGMPDTPGAAGAEIVVDVSGKVREPGVHRLPAGSRVADALKAAGGVRPGTDTDSLNRARFLVDGEQVVVGGPAPAPGAGGVPAGAAAAAPGGGPAGATAPVSLNTATLDQLDTLPGVGPVLAQHILDYRTQHGGFRSVDELREVNGIGDRRFADLRNLVRP
ncbi:helix-hairpin-helix domain-containing protein [Streptomyces griseorubiginosus]|uniref:helix-hairpin-helix domain-containing protein n=1 Tax=Streptomyces griseorubiginosus TaxID=67304 RepID=UPI00363E8413